MEKPRGTKPKGFTLSHLRQEFLSTLHSLSKPYQQMQARVTEWLVFDTPAQIRRNPQTAEPRHFEKFRDRLAAYQFSARHSYEYCARRFFSWCWTRGAISAPPRELYPTTPGQPKPRSTLVDEYTWNRLLQAASPAAALVLRLGWQAGLRVTEMVRATCRDWSRDGHLTVHSLKRAPVRRLQATPDLSYYLDAITKG